ncbi:hypothetical protein [Mycobacterium uberis]|nr:hypothetical protein [Mycobacterium uberis]
MVILTGVGGVGEKRLALQVVAQLAGEVGGGWYVDLALTSNPDLAPTR